MAGLVDIAPELHDDRAMVGRVTPAQARAEVLPGPGRALRGHDPSGLCGRLGRGQPTIDDSAVGRADTIDRGFVLARQAQDMEDRRTAVGIARIQVAPGEAAAGQGADRLLQLADWTPVDGQQPAADQVGLGTSRRKHVDPAVQRIEAEVHGRSVGRGLAAGVAVVRQGGDPADLHPDRQRRHGANVLLHYAQPGPGLLPPRGRESPIRVDHLGFESPQVLQQVRRRRAAIGLCNGCGREQSHHD